MKSISKIWQRTPISYYGGKQTMLPYILPLIPKHEVYTESFFGGGAVFWAKEQVKTEIINDFNTNVYNFYKVLKYDFQKLKRLVENTVISRDVYKSALVIYNTPHLFSETQRAWAFWFSTNFGFSNQVMNCRITSNSKSVKLLNNKIENFNMENNFQKKNIFVNWKDIEKSGNFDKNNQNLEIQENFLEKIKVEKNGFLIKELILGKKEKLNPIVCLY